LVGQTKTLQGDARTHPPFAADAKKSGSTSRRRERRNESSFIRTMTVGSSIELDLLTPVILAERGALAGLRLSPLTAGGEFHPALKTIRI
jgi:hypothetical protein